MFRILFTIGLLFSALTLPGQASYDRSLMLMGTRFDITVVAEDQDQGNDYIDLAIAEIQRIESIISSWNPNSETSLINRSAGKKPVEVSLELFQLIQRAINISKLTDGAFDISYASMDRIWQFDGSMKEMPDSLSILKSVSKVGFENIQLDENSQSVFLKEIGMKIGFGAIGKGYAADKTKELLKSGGVSGGIINAAGDLNAWGKRPNGEDWKIAINNPLNRAKVFAWLPINNGSIVTSGDYEKHVTFGGIRYAHIINPKTGYPSKGIISVSVMASSAELADALATSIFVMGSEVGIHFIDQLPNVECIIVNDQNKVITSKGIDISNEG